MWWLDFFKGKKEEVKPWENEIFQLKQATQASFSNVKRDILAVSGWIAYLQKADEEKNYRLEEIEQQLIKVTKKLDKIREEEDPQPQQIARLHLSDPIQEPTGVVEHFDLFKKLETLTFQQRNLFNILCKIAMESDNEWKSLLDIAHEVYGAKKYDEVRTTLSAYTSRLEELGLVERLRKGRFVYVRVNESVRRSLKKGDLKVIGRKIKV
jgi:DNA-binding transcriptional ArsR family regulator